MTKQTHKPTPAPAPAASIQVAAHQSGLNANTIRAWEARYGAISPKRSSAGRRVYSSGDIKRLLLLRQATDHGYRIGSIADYPTRRLQRLIDDSHIAQNRLIETGSERPRTDSVMEHFDMCLAALTKLDTSALQKTLSRATQELSPLFFLEDLLTPLIHHVRNECYRGMLGNGHLRVFQAIVSSYLLLLNASIQNEDPPRVITCSLKRDNELYALRASAAVNVNGYSAIYLGDRASPDEVVEVFKTSHARIVILCSGGINESIRVPNSVREIHRKIKSEHLLFAHSSISTYTQIAKELNIPEAHDSAELIQHIKSIFKSDA